LADPCSADALANALFTKATMDAANEDVKNNRLSKGTPYSEHFGEEHASPATSAGLWKTIMQRWWQQQPLMQIVNQKALPYLSPYFKAQRPFSTDS
jgi:hypothetical protein